MPLKIYDHPQKKEYADPSEWPPISFQGQFVVGNSNVVSPPGTLVPFQAHTHIEGKWPYDAELGVGDQVTVAFKIILYHTEGVVTNVWGGPGIYTSFIWDATGTDVPPPMVGDPTGEVEWTGKATFDPTRGSHGFDPPPLHGIFSLGFAVRVKYTNGNLLNTTAFVPYFSVLDPSAPVEPMPKDGFDELRAQVFPGTFDPGGASSFGSNNTILRGHQLPILAPINQKWPMNTAVYGYGIPNGIPPGIYENREDPDAHHGNPGRLLHTNVTAATPDGTIGGFVDTDPLDPVILGLGKHKLAFDWIQSGKGGDPAVFLQNPSNAVWSRVVITVEITDDPNVPPPPSTDLVLVPNIIGQTAPVASAAIVGAGLRVGSTSQANAPAPFGIVFTQNPVAGTSVSKLSMVGFTTSLGPTTPPQPDDWHTAPEPMEPQQLGTGPRRRIKIGDKTVELT